MLKLFIKDVNSQAKTPLKKLQFILLEHSIHLAFWIRFGGWLRKIPVAGKLLSHFVEYFIRVVYASDISCKAKIGGGLFISHGHDIVIGAKVIIGENCKIFNGVTLGGKNTEMEGEGQPHIGNNVVISTGAKVLGPVTIGDNCIIGANSVVIKSVEANCVVAGVPAKIIKRINVDSVQ
jgi:serine O-acetyltransferase